MQRHELELQRRALELQTHELKSMAEYAALEQVNHIVSGALKKLKEGPEATNDPSKLHFGILGPNSSSHVQTILNSTDPQIVIKTYTEYGTINTPILNFVFSITNAAKLYLKSTGNLYLDYSLNSYEFLLKYQSKVESIPHISEFYGAVAPIVLTMNILKPQEKSINLAAYIAVFKSTSRTKSKNLQEDQHYNEGIEYHKRNKIDLPAIAII